MRRGLVWLLGMTPALAFGGPDGPLQWSPESRWLSYTVAGPAERPIPKPGWLFGNGRGAPFSDPYRRGGANARHRVYRIYASNPDSTVSVLLEESRWPLTSPGWSPDGRSLAFGRVTAEGPGSSRFELVIQEGLKQQRVLLTRALGEIPPALDELPSVAPAWSPDGRYLAVPNVANRPGIDIVRADNGRILKTVEGVTWPAWSPDGTKLALIRGPNAASLDLMDTGFNAPRHLADLGQTYQPPTWSRDGRSILAVARRAGVRGKGVTQQVDLIRVQVDSGVAETVAPVGGEPIQEERSLRGVALALDRDAEEVFSSIEIEGQPSTIVWLRTRNLETVHRTNPLDTEVPVGSLALSPVGKTLAMRLGAGRFGGASGLWEVGSGRLTLLASDEPTRLDCLSLLITTGRRLLQASLPAAEVQGREVSRPTMLPVPGEIPANQELVFRLRRIGRLGRPLCDRPAVAAGSDPALETYLAEARLFFDVLREDYPAALASLDALEDRTTDPDDLLQLLTVRAQVFIGLDHADRARDTIDYLLSLEDRATSRLELTPTGLTLTPEPSPTRGWARYLARSLDLKRKVQTTLRLGDGEPLGNRNPDAPLPPPEIVVPFRQRPDPALLRRRRFVPVPAPAGMGNEEPDLRVRFRRPRPIPGLFPPQPLVPRAIPPF